MRAVLGYAVVILCAFLFSLELLVLWGWQPSASLPVLSEHEQTTVDYVLSPVDPLPGREDVNSIVKTFWTPDYGSPLMLLPLDEAVKYVPTQENLLTWIATVPELADVDGIAWTNELRYLWGVCLQQQALIAFVLAHEDREQERWHDREQSVSLEAELQPVREFMDRHLGQDREVWRLVNLFSHEVQAKIRGEGEEAPDRDDAESTWALHSALVVAGSPSFDAVVDIITGD